MRGKRYLSLLLAAALALALAGCGANEDKEKKQDGAMTIQPAQFSEEESGLLELLDVGMDTHRVFDVQAEGVKSVRLRAYELVDGAWNCVKHGACEAADGAGRTALTFGKMTEGVRMAYKDTTGVFAQEFAMEAEDASGMVFVTSVLTKSRDIVLDEEIPLALQIATTRNEFSTYDVDYFGMPRELEKHGYEHIYAITVTFSASAPSEPLDAPPAEPSPES